MPEGDATVIPGAGMGSCSEREGDVIGVLGAGMGSCSEPKGDVTGILGGGMGSCTVLPVVCLGLSLISVPFSLGTLFGSSSSLTLSSLSSDMSLLGRLKYKFNR